MKPDKLAEEIISKYDIDFVTESDREYYTNEIIRAMQEYYKSKLAKITDEDIEASLMIRGEMADYVVGYIEGAKAMRNGKIKHT